ncbi:hypothetical protein SCALM49S_03723 [Streptomyces californicus]
MSPRPRNRSSSRAWARWWWTPAGATGWGEFRGVAGPYWSLRPVGGGTEWEAEPQRVRPALLMEQLRARTARLNARSRGEVL